MPVQIPLSGTPRETLLVTIEGRPLELRVRYMSFLDRWIISIFDRAAQPPVPLVVGIPITVGLDLLGQYALGIGKLYAVPMDGRLTDPRRDGLKVRVKLLSVGDA